MVKRILSIEDDVTTHLLNKLYLDESKFCEEYIEVFNGQGAIDFLETIDNESLDKMPELILLDLNMPVMDGWEFLETFEKQYPQLTDKTKIYVLSSSINPKDKERAEREKLIVGFLEKPLDFSQIARLEKDFAAS
jgi:CheY-like chemotaxis protein